MKERLDRQPHWLARIADETAGLPILCFSHLRWNFVFQRPQHLMKRMALTRQVFFIEEPIFSEQSEPAIRVSDQDGVTVVEPLLPEGCWYEREMPTLRRLIDGLVAQRRILEPILWYYTPMWLACSDHLRASAVVYDCMDELTLFKNAPEELRSLERRLMARADVVFTGGRSLFQAKRAHHSNIHSVPSSIDFGHFAQARRLTGDPADQGAIPHPRIGFAGVIDERFDPALVAQLASKRPDWHFVMIGPVVKIEEAALPRGPNLHYLGLKDYKQLPAYLAGWDAAILPFALNEATRYISPTKTPEFLAAGLPVVSTPITDVVEPYGSGGFVGIASDAAGFSAALERCLGGRGDVDRLRAVDAFLSHNSWDRTFHFMSSELARCITAKNAHSYERVPSPVQTDVFRTVPVELEARSVGAVHRTRDRGRLTERTSSGVGDAFHAAASPSVGK